MFADVFLLRDHDLFEPLRLDLLRLDHSNSNHNSIVGAASSRAGSVGSAGIRSGGLGALGQGQGRGSYVLHSLTLCEALTHRLARHTGPCLGSGFAAVFAVGTADKGSGTGPIRSVADKDKDKEGGDDDDDVFSVDGALYPPGDDAKATKTMNMPKAVAGAVASTTQSWRIMKRLVAEVTNAYMCYLHILKT